MARWLEILAEFSYTLEHKAGLKHGNADGLSRQSCEDCRQCELIGRRDGGPTRQELDQDTESISSPALKVATRGDDSSEDLLCRAVKIVTRTAQSDIELAREQATGVGSVSIVYRALRNHIEVTAEQLEWNSLELRKLHKMMDSLRIWADGVLEARLPPLPPTINHGGVPCAHPRFEIARYDKHMH